MNKVTEKNRFCVNINGGASNSIKTPFSWNMDNCGERLNYICEKGKIHNTKKYDDQLVLYYGGMDLHYTFGNRN